MPYNLKIRPSRVEFVLLALAFRAVLDLAYYLFVAPNYAYTGLGFEPAAWETITLSYLLIIFTASLITVSSERPSDFIVCFLYSVSYIPATSLMAFGGFPAGAALWLTAVFVFLFLLSKKRVNMRPRFSFGKRKEFLFLVLLSGYILGFIALITTHGFRMPSSNIFEVYVARSEFKESAETSFALAYILPWQGNIISPFLAAWSFINRRVVILTVVLIGQLALFAIAGFKSQLLAIPFIIWIFAGIRFFRYRLIYYTLSSCIILVVSAMFIDYIYEDFIVDAVLTLRIFYIPSQLYYYYCDFFGKNPFTYFSQNKPFSWFLEYPYSVQIPYLIADHYFSKPEMSANANMWASGYASLGVAGMFLYTFLLWLLINLIDNLSRNKNVYLAYALLAIPFFSLTNSEFLTVMLTHGMLLSIILLILLPNESGPANDTNPSPDPSPERGRTI